MEICRRPLPRTPVDAVLFDFDGTISTLRHGWEAVMEPMMVACIGQDAEALVRRYIDESTGIQTIFQMKWLAEQVAARHGQAESPWAYKAEYNRRLMVQVLARRQALAEGTRRAEDYLIAGSRALLETLRGKGIALYIASGTDDRDVKQEVEVLGLSPYFAGIKGAPEGEEGCSKEAVIRALIDEKGIPGAHLAVVGDGKVEIAIGRENGARTLGVASDEAARRGVDPVKRARLVQAGADAIVGDFEALADIEAFLGGTPAC